MPPCKIFVYLLVIFVDASVACMILTRNASDGNSNGGVGLKSTGTTVEQIIPEKINIINKIKFHL